MAAKGHIDRKKHEVDITERVLAGGGVWTGSQHPHRGHVVNLELDRDAWPLGSVSSAVQVEVRDRHDDERS